MSAQRPLAVPLSAPPLGGGVVTGGVVGVGPVVGEDAVLVGISEHLALYLETRVLSFNAGHMNWVYLVSPSTKIFSQGICVRSSMSFAVVQKRWSAPLYCTYAPGVSARSV